MIYLYLFGTCFHFIYVFMIIGNNCSTSRVAQFLGYLYLCPDYHFSNIRHFPPSFHAQRKKGLG